MSLLSGQGHYCRDLLLLLCLAFTLADTVSSQLVGCDVLGCQTDSGCTLGNITSSYIGTTSVNSTVSPNAPLTWTVGASTQGNSSSSAQVHFIKNFYLGYPPSLDLANTSDFAGCTLFFEGIARSIVLNGTSEYGSVTCGQTLGDGCVSDLQAQAQQKTQELYNARNGDSSSVCAGLQSALQTQPPASCQSTATVTWGNVVAKEITGPNAPLTPIKQTACHPSTGGAGYQVALIETQNVASEEVSSDNVPFFFSMTPVMTIFYKSPGAGFKLESQPEAHLSCLKVVEDSTVSPSAQNAATMLLPRLSFRTALFVLGLSAIALG
ncbi:hypothetical protein HRR83_009191 [Exophiala dermatitidis]|uniref:Uncharacterized protein n=2 Tax=Exophiala dermatitidis TaxID=5970 RepID=H6BUR6_EXODN|nr:uncharacterized protein HMPREF1120_03877 [Exophiala dermatitidis NIH/UT8656]KAJ4502244.1 hypothetical protein HRR75_008573 [Exophiala dermatitidis]EHY55753.1 hypothetical protein HMPREF1120_03877 [Exophiala dermatitidis NIH/UT8656]KAJ4502995.1 hypothetical protein HRR73_009269 [Exophiala dermatitidis]KAJ4503418.1 hypothetical protein HRR74_009325 [Exophiala dermatitidis]KAJ4535439.1 hypothetical protein HRR77_008054 [Exophiala dermatitidis]